jgi:thiamine monophosphate synthase
VSQENIEKITAAGGQRIAVGQAICQSPDPRRAAEELVRVVRQASSRSQRIEIRSQS